MWGCGHHDLLLIKKVVETMRQLMINRDYTQNPISRVNECNPLVSSAVILLARAIRFTAKIADTMPTRRLISTEL